MPGSLRGFRIWVRQIQHLVATVSIATTSVRPHVQAIAVGLELTSITLPESIQSLLADELAKANRGAHARTARSASRSALRTQGEVVTARQARPGQSTVRARTELACRIDRVNLVLFGPVAIPDGPSLSVRGLWGRGDSGKNCLPPLLSFGIDRANAIGPPPSVISSVIFELRSFALISACSFSATGIPKSIGVGRHVTNFLSAATINLNMPPGFGGDLPMKGSGGGRLCACIVNTFRRRRRS